MQAKCSGWRVALLAVAVAVAVLVGVGSGSARGAVDTHATPAWSPLPYPQALRPQVEFWTRIFGVYSEYQVVIHDAVHLDKVYAVLDFRPLLEKHSEARVRKLKDKRTKQELKKVRAALRKLHNHGAKGRSLSSREKKIRDLFKDIKERHKFRKAAAKGRLRAQSGIRERFRQSLRLSGRYLPRMEAIFRQKGLPVVLTRLPLIESSFNIRAYSKVGAAGIWQFMPATGRLFLTINHEVDERLDPLIATRAAADLLKSNYDKLQTWPLAVTAYNHGPAGMARAVRQVGTRDIVQIIRSYKSRTFGFASRNFYVELLAAIQVEQDSVHYFGPLHRDPLLQYDEVELRHYVSLAHLADAANTSPERLLALNPSFGPLIQNGKLHVPRGHRLRIPAGAQKDFARRYAGLSPKAKADRQAVASAFHKVRRGQTLGGIAQRYGTSVRTLRRLNGLRNSHFIRIGQRLRVPLRGQGRRPAARSVRAARQAVLDGTHIVRSGESLGEIAQRYNTTVAALTRLNGIKNAGLIRVGKKLRIVAGSPDKTQYVKHRVRQGQTLGGIARRYGTKVSVLKRLNGVKNVKRLQIGQVLRIPAG